MLIRFDIDAQIAWRALRDRKTETWVGVCDALKLTARGDTWQDLCRMIEEIQEDLFRELLAEGTLERFLSDHGWKPLVPIPARFPEGIVRFDVPTSIVPDRHAQA